jgi:hypothetical protein
MRHNDPISATLENLVITALALAWLLCIVRSRLRIIAHFIEHHRAWGVSCRAMAQPAANRGEAGPPRAFQPRPPLPIYAHIMLARPRTLPTGFIAPCLPTKADTLPRQRTVMVFSGGGSVCSDPKYAQLRSGGCGMLRHLQRAAWIAAFICLVSGFGIAVWKASQQVLLREQAAQHVANKNVSAGQDEAWKPFGQVWRETLNDPTALFTFWVAFFTFVLAASTIGLWIVAICTLRHSRETAERQLRAYISLDGGSARIVGTIDLAA